MEEPQRAHVKRTLDHMSEHDGNIKYDKYTGEIQYDGVRTRDSDVRELFSTFTSKKRGEQLARGEISLCAHRGIRTHRLTYISGGGGIKVQKWGLGCTKRCIN